MCFVFIWEQTATCATYIINWLVFTTEMKSVYCAVRTESLNKAVCASSLKGSSRLYLEIRNFFKYFKNSAFIRSSKQFCCFPVNLSWLMEMWPRIWTKFSNLFRKYWKFARCYIPYCDHVGKGGFMIVTHNTTHEGTTLLFNFDHFNTCAVHILFVIQPTKAQS